MLGNMVPFSHEVRSTSLTAKISMQHRQIDERALILFSSFFFLHPARAHRRFHDVSPPPPAQICGSFMIINGTIHMCASTVAGVRVTPVEADIPPQAVLRR